MNEILTNMLRGGVRLNDVHQTQQHPDDRNGGREHNDAIRVDKLRLLGEFLEKPAIETRLQADSHHQDKPCIAIKHGLDLLLSKPCVKHSVRRSKVQEHDKLYSVMGLHIRGALHEADVAIAGGV